MIKLKCKSTNQEIEVSEIDAHWYNGHEDYEEIYGSLETLPKNAEIASENAGHANENGQEKDGKENGQKNADENDGKRKVLRRGRPRIH